MADDIAILGEEQTSRSGIRGWANARKTWWLSFALLVCLGAAWALATPIFASPDEPSQAIRAWSVAHGELLGKEFGPHNGPPNPLGPANLPHVWGYGLSVDAPATYQGYGQIQCLAFAPSATANCLSLGNSTRIVPALTYHGRYFPAYYFLVGLPSFLRSPGAGQIYLMRLASVLLAAALLASAIVSTRRTGSPSIAAAGVVVAITPMVLFLAASINPSGLEIAAAIAVWTSGSLLAKSGANVDRRLVDRLGVAAVALAVARPLGPLWLAIAGVILALVAGFAHLRALWQSTRVRVWMGVLVGATAVHLGWNVWAGTYDPQHYQGVPNSLSAAEIARVTTGKGYWLLQQMVGVFGWLDTLAPSAAVVIWLLIVGALVGLTVGLASGRWILAVGLVLGLTVVLPILLEGLQVRQVGFAWQGRYTLPLAVGVPVLAGFSLAEAAFNRAAQKRLAAVLIVGLTVAQVLAFSQALRRYSVGANGTVWFFTRALWKPPIPGLLLVLGFTATTAIFLGWVLLPRAATSEAKQH